MKKLRLIALLAIAHKKTANEEIAVLLNTETWNVVARGAHPVGETFTTAHTAVVNVLQNENVATRFCLTTYTPTGMCEGMAHNLKATFIALGDDLERGDEVGADSLPDVNDDARQFLTQARRLKGTAKAVVDSFDRAALHRNRRALSGALSTALAHLPSSVPFRFPPEKTAMKNCFMALSFSLVALTWSETNMHARNLSIGEALCGNNVGAVIVHKNQIIAWGLNFGAEHLTLHAETVAIQAYLARTGNTQLPDNCVIYTSLQPCHMCAGFILQSCPNAAVIYGLKDGKLKTCIRTSEQIWANQFAYQLAEAIQTARSTEVEEYSTIHYLRGATVFNRFMAAFPLLQLNPSGDERLVDLQMHCMEMLRIVGEEGMATGDGLDILVAAMEAEPAIVLNREERETYQLIEILTNHYETAREHEQRAKSAIEKASDAHKSAKKQAAIVEKQLADAQKIRQDAEAARDLAKQAQKSPDARPHVEAAEQCIKRMLVPRSDGLVAFERVCDFISTGLAHVDDVTLYAQLAIKAVDVAIEARDKLAEAPKGMRLENIQQKVAEHVSAAEQMRAMLVETKETARLAQQQIEQCLDMVNLAAASAKLARTRLIKLSEVSAPKQRAERDATDAVENAKLAWAHVQTALEQLAELEQQVEQYESSKARERAKAALEEAHQNVDEAYARAMKANKAAKIAQSILMEVATNIERMRSTSSEQELLELQDTVKNELSVIAAKKGKVELYSQSVESSLKSVQQRILIAKAPIKCSACPKVLAQDTTEKARWHECTSCHTYYCNDCGYRRTRAAMFSQERRCTCGGTTMLI